MVVRASLPQLRGGSSARVWCWIAHRNARIGDYVLNPIWYNKNLIRFSVVRLNCLYRLQLIKRWPWNWRMNHSWAWRAFASGLDSHISYVSFILFREIDLDVASVVFLRATERQLLNLFKTMSLDWAVVVLVDSRDIAQGAIRILLI